MLGRELTFAHEMADIARSIVSSFAREDLNVRTKRDATPVTDADTAVERSLREAVASRFPSDGFLGEEGGFSSDRDRAWVVDPIDGTKNFVDGVQLWGVLIALIDDGMPALGLVDLPGLGERYVAVRGEGASLNGSAIHVSSVGRLEEALVVHSGVEEWLGGPYWQGFQRVVAACRRTRGLSDAWGHMLVARGSAEVVLEHEPCGVWDYSPVRVILEEAGGRITTLEGAEPHPECNLLSTNGRFHEDVLTRLRRG